MIIYTIMSQGVLGIIDLVVLYHCIFLNQKFNHLTPISEQENVSIKIVTIRNSISIYVVGCVDLRPKLSQTIIY